MAASSPSFTKDVAPILFQHCANCHREGEIAASMPLVSYDSVRPKAESIKKAILDHTMPPWPADPAHSARFRNDPRLSQHEIDTLIAWMTAGMPRGSDADLPPLPSVEQGWLHPQGLEPDLVITLPRYHLPATGEIPYVQYLAKIPFDGDKWVTAMQVRPGNRAVVHHMAITEVQLNEGVTPESLQQAQRAAEKLGIPSSSIAPRQAVWDPTNPAAFDMLGVYTPGTTFEQYEDNSARLLKGGKNFYLSFNIHYQTTGKPEVDQSMLAFWFRKDPPRYQLYRVPASAETIIVNGKELLTDAPGEKAEGTVVALPPIPPNTANYEVIGITAYTHPVTIYQMQPHAHLRGKDFTYMIVYPDGREETVLTVPKYQFHWQLAYELETPRHLPAGSKLVVIAHYDNSANNEHLRPHHGMNMGDPEHSPSPNQEVSFRETNQSWDEMFTPFIQYSIDDQDPGRAPSSHDDMSQSAGQNVVQISESVGCLEQGKGDTWMLTKATHAEISKTQPTSSAEVQKEAAKALSNSQYRLLGVSFFNPAKFKGEKVVVKGVLVTNGAKRSLNTTSLQMLAPKCF